MERSMNKIALVNAQINAPQVAYGVDTKYFNKFKLFIKLKVTSIDYLLTELVREL